MSLALATAAKTAIVNLFCMLLMFDLCCEYHKIRDKPTKKHFLISTKKFGKNGPTKKDFQCFNRNWKKYLVRGAQDFFKRNTRYPREEDRLIKYINSTKKDCGGMPTLKQMQDHLLKDNGNKNFKASYEFVSNVLKKNNMVRQKMLILAMSYPCLRSVSGTRHDIGSLDSTIPLAKKK